MRHGPMVRRSPNTSRLTHGATTPLARLQSIRGLAALHGSKDPRNRSEDAGLESNRLNLMGMLPINLRNFRGDRLGAMLHIDDESTLELDSSRGDQAIRELARAIRRFSAERARESWLECAVKLGRVASELARMPSGQRQVVLCLRCASIGMGPDALSRHGDAACLALELGGPIKQLVFRTSSAKSPIDSVRRAIEDFRVRRAASGLPHFDLDCYMSNDQMVFTWRPMTGVACEATAAQSAGLRDAAATVAAPSEGPIE